MTEKEIIKNIRNACKMQEIYKCVGTKLKIDDCLKYIELRKQQPNKV